MNERENAQAGKEAREAAAERVSSAHTTEQLAERAIRQYLKREERADRPDAGHDDDR